MAKEVPVSLLQGIAFPRVPEAPPEDVDTLRLVASAHAGLLEVYDRLAGATEGATRVVIDLLRRDWRKRSEPGLRITRSCLEVLVEERGAAKIAPCPSAKDAEKLAKRLVSSPLSAVLAALEEIATRCSVCLALVPLGSASPDVRNAFRRCVEVEDFHLGQIGWFRALCEEGVPGS